MEKIKVHIDTLNYDQKPKEDIGRIKQRVQSKENIKEVDIDTLIKYITTGFTISPGIMIGGCKSINWTEQTLFMVDIDNNNQGLPILSINDAITICNAKNIKPTFVYKTFSNTDQKPKYRLCFITNTPIKDTHIRKIIIETLISLFKQSDQTGKNADRIFFGSNQEALIINLNNRITIEQIINYHERISIELQQNTNTELDTLKQHFDFFSYLKNRNGTPKINNPKYAQFEYCELCGHKNDLTYYHETKTFMCFSSSVNKGGSIIDYIKILNNCTTAEAIEHFKYEILQLPKKTNTTIKENKIITNKFAELNITENYTIDDKGISKLFADTYKTSLRFNTTCNEWFYYNGKVWSEDKKGMVAEQKAEEFVDNLLIYTNKIDSEAYKQDLLKYCHKLGNYKNRQNLINDSKNVHYIMYKDLDKNDDLINCQNGTLNLETLEFKAHDANDLITKITNVIYDITKKPILFSKFISEVFENNNDKIDYLQQLLGYSLTTNTTYEECYILLGTSTRNGKSTLVETISYMLGNNNGYAMNIMPETLAIKFNKDSRTASGDIARLKDCRLLTTSEPPKNMLIDNAFLKNITGRDRITARHLHQDEIEFVPKFKLFINTNHLPYITDMTLFDSGRINVITFNRHFNENEQDRTLKDKLREDEEISGIFNWCLEGLKKIKSEGIQKPQCIKDDTAQYKKQSDIIGEYVEERLIKNNHSTKLKDVYEDYKIWCEKSGNTYELKSSFIQNIKERNLFTERATINGKTEKNVISGYSNKKETLINNICE